MYVQSAIKHSKFMEIHRNLKLSKYMNENAKIVYKHVMEKNQI